MFELTITYKSGKIENKQIKISDYAKLLTELGKSQLVNEVKIDKVI